LFTDVEPWPESVGGAELLDDLRTTVQRFIVCNGETAVAACLWIAFTWFIDAVQVAPLGMITAPERRCGKTQLLSLIGSLSRRPLVASNISPAAIFRVVEAHAPTLLIDEADAFLRDNEEARGLLNSGHTRQSAYVIRTVGDDHEPKQFSTWGAKAISGIGHLHETLMDRSVILELRRKLPSESVERLRHAEPGLFDALASRLARWADDEAHAVSRARPALPDALNDRAQDNWEPLLAIADLAGGDWPRLARDAALRISGAEQDSKSLTAELLEDVRGVFEARRIERMRSTDLLAALVEDEERPWAAYNRGRPMTPHQLSKRLGEYGIKPKNIRVSGGQGKGYDLADMRDAFARYLASAETPPEIRPTVTSKELRGSQRDASPESARPGTLDIGNTSRGCDGLVGDTAGPIPGGGTVADSGSVPLGAAETLSCYRGTDLPHKSGNEKTEVL
jgi:putative DNA primase/helicase